MKLGFWLIGFADLALVRQAREEFPGGAEPPASALAQVAGLARSFWDDDVRAMG